MIQVIVSIAYFFGAFFAIAKFGWLGFGMIYAVGMGLVSLAAKKEGSSVQISWLLLGPPVIFLVGGIAGSIAMVPLYALGILPSSGYVDDEDFFTHP